MAKLKPGDRVDCRIKDHVIIDPYEDDFRETRTVEIIGTDYNGYFLFAPDYFNLKETIRIDPHEAKDHHIDDRFLGERMVYIKEGMISQINYVFDGMYCSECKKYFLQVISNTYNNGFICWECSFIKSMPLKTY